MFSKNAKISKRISFYFMKKVLNKILENFGKQFKKKKREE